jgi:hypothetical protein
LHFKNGALQAFKEPELQPSPILNGHSYGGHSIQECAIILHVQFSLRNPDAKC